VRQGASPSVLSRINSLNHLAMKSILSKGDLDSNFKDIINVWLGEIKDFPKIEID